MYFSCAVFVFASFESVNIIDWFYVKSENVVAALLFQRIDLRI